MRDFESAINAKKQELERVSKKLEEVSSTLRCESLVFFVINKSLFIFSPLILSTFIFSATWTTSQHLLVATRQLFSPCLLVHTYILIRNDIVLCTVYDIFCTLSQFSCSRKDCLSLPCPTFPMQAPSFLILPLGVNSLAASLQKRFKISASLCLSFVALPSYHAQLSTYLGTDVSEQ